MARWLAVLVAGALVLGACGGGGGKLSAAECEKERAKLFEQLGDLQKMAEKFNELAKKGCATTSTDGGSSHDDTDQGSAGTGLDPKLLGSVSKECQDLSLEVAAKGLEALQARDDPDKLKRLDEELAALRAKLEKECPQVASSTGG